MGQTLGHLLGAHGHGLEIALYADGAACTELHGLIVAKRDVIGTILFAPEGHLESLDLADGVTNRVLPDRVIRAAENAAWKHVTAARRELAGIAKAQRRRRVGQ